MFDTKAPLAPIPAPPEEVIDCLVEDQPGVAEPVRWSGYLPDGMLADLLAQPAETEPEHREFKAATRSRASSLVMDLATSLQMALGGAFSPIRSQAGQSTMAPPGTAHPHT